MFAKGRCSSAKKHKNSNIFYNFSLKSVAVWTGYLSPHPPYHPAPVTAKMVNQEEMEGMEGMG